MDGGKSLRKHGEGDLDSKCGIASLTINNGQMDGKCLLVVGTRAGKINRCLMDKAERGPKEKEERSILKSLSHSSSAYLSFRNRIMMSKKNELEAGRHSGCCFDSSGNRCEDLDLGGRRGIRRVLRTALAWALSPH